MDTLAPSVADRIARQLNEIGRQILGECPHASIVLHTLAGCIALASVEPSQLELLATVCHEICIEAQQIQKQVKERLNKQAKIQDN